MKQGTCWREIFLLLNENGLGGSSPHCFASCEKSILRPIQGVGRFLFLISPMKILAPLGHLDRFFDGGSPSLPSGKTVQSNMTRHLRKSRRHDHRFGCEPFAGIGFHANDFPLINKKFFSNRNLS